MASRTLTIAFLASSGIHAALVGGLMVAGFEVGHPSEVSAEPSQTTIAFAPFAGQVDERVPEKSFDQLAEPKVKPPAAPELVPVPRVEPLVVAPVVPPLPEVKLGIDDGRDDSKNWIGFKDPTEFRAPKSAIDQAEVSLHPGNPSIASGAPGKPGAAGNPGLPGTAADASAKQDQSVVTPPAANPPAAAAPTEPDKTLIQKQAEASNGAAQPKGDGQKDVKEEKAVTPLNASSGAKVPVVEGGSIFDEVRLPVKQGSAEAAATDSGTDDVSRKPIEAQAASTKGSVQANADAKVNETQKPEAKEAVTGAAQPAPQHPPQAASQSAAQSAANAAGNQGNQGAAGNNATGANVAGDKPGEQDDREADASAVIDSIDVIPGKPAAAKGLRIQTSRPQWSMSTKLTARPRNPSIRITFGPTGRVTNAEFAIGKSTGYPEVDQPLLNAIYRWTARGEAIDKLSPSNPRAGVTITVNILLN